MNLQRDTYMFIIVIFHMFLGTKKTSSTIRDEVLLRGPTLSYNHQNDYNATFSSTMLCSITITGESRCSLPKPYNNKQQYFHLLYTIALLIRCITPKGTSYSFPLRVFSALDSISVNFSYITFLLLSIF